MDGCKRAQAVLVIARFPIAQGGAALIVTRRLPSGGGIGDSRGWTEEMLNPLAEYVSVASLRRGVCRRRT